MTRQAATDFEDTQPYVRPPERVHTRPPTGGAARLRGAALMACIAAGVAGGALLKQPAPRLAQHTEAPAAVQDREQSASAVLIEPQQETDSGTAPSFPAPHEIRAQLRYVELQQGRRMLDASSRLLLARSAAQQAALQEVGLDYRDVYGVIHAESSWVPRPGLGKNGVVSTGLAQFEPATARAVGLRNPHDPVEAVHAAAKLLKEAAVWSARRLDGQNLDTAQRAARLREGVSVYYNLSSRGRMAWQGNNSHQLPVETRLHIRNVRAGALRADLLTGGNGAGLQPEPMPLALATAAAPPSLAPATAGDRIRVAHAGVPRPSPRSAWVRTADGITLPEGTISWSSRGSRSTSGS